MSYAASLPPGYPEATDGPDMLENNRSEAVGKGNQPMTQDEVDEEMNSDDEMEDNDGDDCDGDGDDDGSSSADGGGSSSSDGSGNGDSGRNKGDGDGDNSDDRNGGEGEGTTKGINVEKDDWMVDGGETSVGEREESFITNEESADAVVRGNNAERPSSRYEKESYSPEQPILTQPCSSISPGVSHPVMSGHERAQIVELEE